ncbi:U6 small nuclear RNA (adenine-(43)-N(6))-methyltransferase [Onthophagus taurus]|uniref:U6 small nuclear RNA (adenine-(43)-N(6))-methyltransferase n=1 Tax=Onthophagus taurus TaxID=166361 RepID=UPI0039BE3F6A
MQKHKMHPRNIYNTRLDFKVLSEISPEFKQHLILKPNGKLTVKFQDPEALRSLAKVLLKKDFNLDIEIPINTLVPTIPLRLNYILFIEDILDGLNMNSDVIGVDIGTGGSCIYPLLASRKNNWKMIGTDSNSVNFKYASANVAKNNLGENIKVIQVSGENTLTELLEKDNLLYTFCMCNPPFFSGVNDLYKSRNPNRKKPNNGFCASSHEIITDGGELDFVQKIILESHNFKDRIKIFSSMLGIKRNLKQLIHVLKQSNQVKSFISTEFFQGNTTRWALAWTFYDYDLNKINQINKNPKPIKPFSYSQNYNGSIENVGIKIEEILNELKMDFKVLEKGGFTRHYNLKAYFNTWTHNRKRRREAKRMEKIMGGVIPMDHDKVEENDEKSAEMDTSFEDKHEGGAANVVFKRKMSESDEDFQDENKKVHGENVNNVMSNTPKLIEASIYVNLRKNNQLEIEITPLSDTTNRNSLHEILQYFKNHLILD